MTIKIALTNLGKYNEGELVFEWLTLPATDEEISAAFQVIGVAPNTEYEEHFITDYEAPFKIGEYSSINKLNELAEVLDGLSGWEAIAGGDYDAGDVISFAHELEGDGLVQYASDYVQDIVHTDDLDEMVSHIVEDRGGWGWIRVKHFLSGINWTRDEYYHIDGYGNAQDLTPDHLEMVLDEILSEFLSEYGL